MIFFYLIYNAKYFNRCKKYKCLILLIAIKYAHYKIEHIGSNYAKQCKAELLVPRTTVLCSGNERRLFCAYQ